MELRLTPELQAQIAQLASLQGKEPETLLTN